MKRSSKTKSDEQLMPPPASKVIKANHTSDAAVTSRIDPKDEKSIGGGGDTLFSWQNLLKGECAGCIDKHDIKDLADLAPGSKFCFNCLTVRQLSSHRTCDTCIFGVGRHMR